ncbi:hypothetical protein [Erythrobacter crassostreae]|uniref:Acid phosphatase n=1 Tax=Erythrobacter crassostreae TaxID=2828328 RepID=A0A9X1F1D9_9SPHN|nr:hypothetical protein [Erythrobacter crassostrea]MBV7258344.1 hypothetical protein [Erythrobacter crassostrea]
MSLVSLTLPGCVAAVIPLVASGAIVQSENNADENGDEEAPTAEQPEAANVVTAETDAASSGVEEAGSLVQPSTEDRSIQSPRLVEFIRYSTQQAFRFSEAEEPLASAVLSNPAALDGERINCDRDGELEPAVLIDLDPGEATYSSNSPLPTSTSIALSLKVLRSEGVTVAWISGNSAADADIVRDALTSSGLDPDAEDTLLLMRYPGDRKQTRRKEFSSETCLIAIAGDNRRDFDELYDYLNNRNAALNLEKLINNGWFLIGPDTPIATNKDEASDPALPLISQSSTELQDDISAAPIPDGKQEQ